MDTNNETVDEAIRIRWLICKNGGNCCKTAVEDVLLLRHPELDRAFFHDVMNHIEYHDLDRRALRDNHFPNGKLPTMDDYPEIKQAAIKWYTR